MPQNEEKIKEYQRKYNKDTNQKQKRRIRKKKRAS